MDKITELTDELGPSKILFVHDNETEMKGVIVVDTNPQGIAGGGTRMLPDISTKEVFKLAREMTYKFNSLDLPIGGAKAGIWADPKLEEERRETVLKSFGDSVKSLLSEGVTLAPDMGTSARDIDKIYEGAGVSSMSSGLSLEEKDGEPLENHATSYGVVISGEEACKFVDFDINEAKVAIEGFGKVGGGVARYMDEKGADVVAISTIHGAIYNEKGLDVEKLLNLREKVGDKVVNEYEDADYVDKEDIYFLPVDILVPGARPYVINEDNAQKVQAEVISSIANIPITDEAHEILFDEGVYAIPHFISNAGGVIINIVDILDGTAEDVFGAVENLLRPLTNNILNESIRKDINPRILAVEKSKEKALKARSEEAPSFEELVELARERLDL